MSNFQGIAKARIGIDDERQIHNAADCHRVVNDLREVHEAEIGQTQVHVGQAGASQVGRLEPEIGDDAGGESVWCARQRYRALAKTTDYP